jgi:hypothetical protein
MAEQTSIGGVPVPQEGEPRFRWFVGKPTVSILFYTDDRRVNLLPDLGEFETEFGVRILWDLLVGDTSGLADFQITVLNRHEPTHASNKLTSIPLRNFNEVWFFGTGLANTPSEPENELTDQEVAALADWMATGGVLMAGDHSNPRSPKADPHLDPLLNLGRAIGHKVPRAGALRRWEGGPPISGPDSYNTQVPTPETPISEIEDLALQEDDWPQQLILKTYPESTGGPLDAEVYRRRVHRLFCGRTGPITVFPDHMHEGHLVIPSTLPADVWPSGPLGQPRPEVIARGTDKRTGEIYDLVIAYDGDEAGVGRIVADSTWHHYFNVNLRGFLPGGPILSQLTQFYVNLAVWLAPPAKRAQIARWQIWKLLHNPTVEMAYRNSRSDLGRAAAGVLRRTAGPCVIRDLFYPILRSERPQDGLYPSEELMLGGVLDAYFDAFERADAGEELGPEDEIDALVARGIRAAHDDFVGELETRLGQAQHARDRLEEQLKRDGDGDSASA